MRERETHRLDQQLGNRLHSGNDQARDASRRTLRRTRPDPLPARTQRVPAHRARQIDLPQLRCRRTNSTECAVCAFDDTNPETEDASYIDAIREDVAWLGFDPGEPAYASDYFVQLAEWAEQLIRAGLAYVDDQDAETISANQGRIHHARHRQPLPRPFSRGEPLTSSRMMRIRGVRRR